jgi:hypothetical protein
MVVGGLFWIALPFLLGFWSESEAQYFFIITGMVIMADGLLTDYDS